MATFNRINKKSKTYLERSLNSILDQTYNNWDLIIVGDKYEPEDELLSIINNYKTILVSKGLSNNIIYINNLIVEREVIGIEKNKLWNCAGANSMNSGLKYARENNYKYYCHLDDDDYWSDNHLISLYNIYNKYPNCVFANTQSTYRNIYLPRYNFAYIKEKIDIFENNLPPWPCNMIHSSISFRIDIIPYNYATIINTNDLTKASDAKMLYDIRSFLINNKQYCSIYNPILTCYHDIEGETKL